MNTPSAKAALRMAALERRALTPSAVRVKFSERLAIEGVAIARRALARSVSAYWPIGEEVDTRYLLEALNYHEFIVALPAVVRRGSPLVFRKWTPRDRLVPRPFNVMEPPLKSPEARPDVLFVPLAAFDRRGHRVGYGAGYYDLTLHELRAMKSVLAIGVAFATQEVEEVPAEAHDERLDFVMTEHGLIECGAD